MWVADESIRRTAAISLADHQARVVAVKDVTEAQAQAAVESLQVGHLPFEQAAKASAELGLAALESCMGNWSEAPHADLKSLLEDKEKRREFLSVLERKGLSLAAPMICLIRAGPKVSRPTLSDPCAIRGGLEKGNVCVMRS